VPAPRFSSLPARRPGLARKQSARQRELRILAQRDRLIADIGRLRQQLGDSSAFLDKANTLLTRWWSPASWKAREKLLASADWLVRLEERRGDDLQASA
jgi:hypothetical protein